MTEAVSVEAAATASTGIVAEGGAKVRIIVGFEVAWAAILRSKYLTIRGLDIMTVIKVPVRLIRATMMGVGSRRGFGGVVEG
jgi:hypothetical protein